MSNLLNQVAEGISKINLRHIMLIFFLLITSTSFIVQQLTKKKRQQKEEDFSQFEKNEEGLYPWEVDTDDSPSRIDEKARRYVNKHQPRRGKWG